MSIWGETREQPLPAPGPRPDGPRPAPVSSRIPLALPAITRIRLSLSGALRTSSGAEEPIDRGLEPSPQLVEERRMTLEVRVVLDQRERALCARSLDQLEIVCQLARASGRASRTAGCRTRCPHRAAGGPRRRARNRRSCEPSRRCAPSPHRFSSSDSSKSTQVTRVNAPRPIRPRSWWSWARPNRSAFSTSITVALGTSTPTSTTVVEISRCVHARAGNVP